jgi:hypothetical protein
MRPPLSLLFGAPGVMFFPADNRCAVGLEITLAYGDAVGLTRSEPVKVTSVYSLCTSAYNENSKKSVMFPWVGSVAHRIFELGQKTHISRLRQFINVGSNCLSKGVEVVAALQT